MEITYFWFDNLAMVVTGIVHPHAYINLMVIVTEIVDYFTSLKGETCRTSLTHISYLLVT